MLSVNLKMDTAKMSPPINTIIEAPKEAEESFSTLGTEVSSVIIEPPEQVLVHAD